MFVYYFTKSVSYYIMAVLTTMFNMILLFTFTASVFFLHILERGFMSHQKLEIVSLKIKV